MHKVVEARSEVCRNEKEETIMCHHVHVRVFTESSTKSDAQNYKIARDSTISQQNRNSPR